MHGPWGRGQDVKLMISHLCWMPESLGLHANPFSKLDLGLPGSMSTGFSVFIQKCSPLISFFFHSLVMYVRRQKSSVGFTQSFLGFLSHQVKLSWAMPPVNDYFQPILPFRKLFSWYTSQNLHFLTPSHYVYLSPYISNFLFPNWIWNPCAQLTVSCRIVHIQLTSYFLLEKPF